MSGSRSFADRLSPDTLGSTSRQAVGPVDATKFSEHFEELVAEPARRGGFESWGKGLWMQHDGVRVAVLRTETRNIWPFRFTLVAGHDCLRDFDDRCPPPRSPNPSEYPVKTRPSDARRLLKRYRYEPHNLGRWPADEMDDGHLRRQLSEIGGVLEEVGPQLPRCLTAEIVLRELERNGEGAWAEARWIEDYRDCLATR